MNTPCVIDGCNGCYIYKVLYYSKLILEKPFFLKLSIEEYKNYNQPDKKEYNQVVTQVCNTCNDDNSIRIQQFIKEAYGLPPKKRIVVLTGAGISQESGLKTFRDSDGLWVNHDIKDVCTTTAWNTNPTLVNDFYNERRIEVLKALPNAAHDALAKLEKDGIFEVSIITTNIDDLHERAGNEEVLHLHGEITKARSSRTSLGTLDDFLLEQHLVPVGKEGIKPMQEAKDGHLLRPHVVFFGEDVPNMEEAYLQVRNADYLIVVGTSLNVYPAASLVQNIPANCRTYYVDLSNDAELMFPCHFYKYKATKGVPLVIQDIYKREIQT